MILSFILAKFGPICVCYCRILLILNANVVISFKSKYGCLTKSFKVSTPHQILLGWSRTTRICGKGDETWIQDSVRKSEGGADGRIILKWSYKRWDGGIDCRCKWWAVTKTRVPQNAENFLASQKGLSSMVLLISYIAYGSLFLRPIRIRTQHLNPLTISCWHIFQFRIKKTIFRVESL